MTYHFTLDVELLYDRGYNMYIPEYLKLIKKVDRNYSCKRLYMSQKYDLLSEMMADFNAVDMPDAKPKFYKNDIRISGTAVAM